MEQASQRGFWTRAPFFQVCDSSRTAQQSSLKVTFPFGFESASVPSAAQLESEQKQAVGLWSFRSKVKRVGCCVRPRRCISWKDGFHTGGDFYFLNRSILNIQLILCVWHPVSCSSKKVFKSWPFPLCQLSLLSWERVAMEIQLCQAVCTGLGLDYELRNKGSWLVFSTLSPLPLAEKAFYPKTHLQQCSLIIKIPSLISCSRHKTTTWTNAPLLWCWE